jgi:glycosyltransferase involved in cell wall biosynthesis
MKSKPLVTVITPTYNRAGLIGETIESVLIQTYSNFEYLIIDDGSTDNTEEVVERYLSDTRVKYFKFENGGEAAAVNRGWNLSKGDYFLQINSDDMLMCDCLEESVSILEKNKNYVVSYPDFLIISHDGKERKITTPDWNFIDALTTFSCHAATPGTTIRRSSFKNWPWLRDSRFLYISDVEMYWNMALVGDFVHIPKTLAKWREHQNGISNFRYKSIIEIKMWFDQYFSKNNFASHIKAETKETIDTYVLGFSHKYAANDACKKALIEYHNAELFNLQVGDNDLIGNKFNGHDLHLYLREKGIYSCHLVKNKQSEDANTYLLQETKSTTANLLQKALHSPNTQGLHLLYNMYFVLSDVVHLHLIHNDVIDVNLLPILTKFKPTVWTIHDPWALGGHCIHHFDCEKWKTHCGDCPYLEEPFAIDWDSTALQFELKKQAIQNSQISAIVASKWMENKIKQSPIWAGKKIYRIPFGINRDLFKPADQYEAKKKLGINPNKFVLFFRSDTSPYKGLNIIKKTLAMLAVDNVEIITVGQTGNLGEFSNYSIKEFGWLTDDNKLIELYQACNLFLMPSKQEAFGMMAIEAMSCGKLVVALNADTALPDTINAPECGIAISEKDYPMEVQRLINSAGEIIEREKKSFEYAEQNYDKNVYVDRIIKVYKEVIASHYMAESAKCILKQLCTYGPIGFVMKYEFPWWYRYLIRPVLRMIFPKHRIKRRYDKKFRK